MKITDIIQPVYSINDFKVDVYESIVDLLRQRSTPGAKRGQPKLGPERYSWMFDSKLLSESTTVDEFTSFKNQFLSLDQRDHVKIKVGATLAVVQSMGDVNRKVLEVDGFLTPKQIVKLSFDGDKIDTVHFSDGSQFPEAAEFSVVNGMYITNTIFFPDVASAQKAYTQLWMLISGMEGNGWRILTRLNECSGYIPKNAKEAKDPRWSNALSVDVDSSTPAKNLKAFGL